MSNEWALVSNTDLGEKQFKKWTQNSSVQSFLGTNLTKKSTQQFLKLEYVTLP